MRTAFDRLAATLFVGTRNPEIRLMAKMTAYFDASGSPDSQPFVVVAGYIANFYQWRVFENSWKAIHSDYGAILPFHMAEFQAATSNLERYQSQRNARQDYIDLAKDKVKATDFFKRICIAQLTIVNCGFSCSVPMSIYNNISSLLDLRTVIPPYALAARTCIHMIHRWEREFNISEPVEYIFEEGDFEQGKFTELMIDEGCPPPIYKKKRDSAGLQGADQFAWEEFFSLKQELQNSNPMVRNSFKVLLEGIPTIRREITTESLIKLCELRGIDPKTGVKK
jgi:hypothetical protein